MEPAVMPVLLEYNLSHSQQTGTTHNVASHGMRQESCA